MDSGAETAIDHALMLAPDKPLFLFTKARVKLAQADPSGALEDVLRRFPAGLAGKMEMARLYWYGGKEEVGLGLAQKILQAGYSPQRALE